MMVQGGAATGAHLQWLNPSDEGKAFAALVRQSVMPEAVPSLLDDVFFTEDMLHLSDGNRFGTPLRVIDGALPMLWFDYGYVEQLSSEQREPPLQCSELRGSDVNALVEVFTLLERWQCEADRRGDSPIES